MLISPPFLLTRNANETDDAWIDRCMVGGVPGQGAFPVSYNLGWHGGMHLDAPMNGAQPEPVRAVADGEVVFLRQPTPQPAGPLPPDHPQAYNGWTDNGVVVIRHTTEIGEGANAAVTFFSITMHLSAIDPAIRQGRAVYRKAQLGTAGQIYGNTQRQIHFEIVCDADNLARLVGRGSGDLPLTTDGRTDTVYGEMYFHLPAGAQVFGQRPLSNNAQAMMQPPGQPAPAPQPLPAVHTTADALVVGMRYAAGEGAAGNRGDAYLTTYRMDGTTLGAAIEENDGEYNLYTSATAISNAYPATGRPAPSAVYELLRFGRVIGPDALTPATVPHWREVRYPGGQGWVNLNAANVHKFSDADFPHWKQWRLIDDAVGQDSRCDSAVIRGWLDANGDGQINPTEATERLNDAATAAKLARTICKFPTEWDAATIDARWGWLKTSTSENPQPLTAADFELLRAHITALAFWPGGMGINAQHWHWQPREFVKHWRKANWLSATDLQRIYSDTDTQVRERYRLAINQVLRRYGMNSALRASHFFGQGQVETLGLRLMVEGSVSFARNPGHASFQSEAAGYYSDPLDLYGYFHNYERVGNDLGNVDRSDLRDRNGRVLPVTIGRDTRNRPLITAPTIGQIDAAQSRVGDGMKFRGRGFKQLTGRSNYAQYWVFRGWLRAGVDFDENWWEPPRRPTDPPRRPAPMNDPQRLSINAFNCIDSGGQFAARNGIARPSDGGVSRVNADNVSRIVNRWDAPSFERRHNGTTVAYEILGP